MRTDFSKSRRRLLDARVSCSSSARQSYQPHVPEEHRAWPYRKALIRDYLLSKDADVICVQEASADTFEADFDFMKDAG